MARASRSSKKQPAFDPNELSDLIFSPAVGTGVGSHLLGKSPEVNGEQDLIGHTDLSTVDMPIMSTAVEQRTVDKLEPDPAIDLQLTDLTTVDDTNLTTVDTLSLPASDLSTVDITYMATVDNCTEDLESATSDQTPDLSTVAKTESTIVVKSDLTTVVSERSTIRLARAALWITENGDLVPQGRVKRIALAQDVINSAEESVYDTLWTSKSALGDERDSSRLVQAGYDYLGKKTRLSKKTIQRIIAKLIDKDFIAIERPADIYQRSSTVYRVFSYKAVLERHVQRGRSHVAKIGPGFSYVRPFDDPRSELAPPGLNVSTVPNSNGTTVDKIDKSPVVNMTTETVDELDLSTVVRRTTTIIGRNVLDNPSSSGIHRELSQYGAVDDDAIRRLIRDCRQQAPDCTEDEIVHFIREKGTLVRGRDSRIHSPIGFLLTAVPKCLSGEAFQLYRQQQAQQREAEAAYETKRQAELDEWRREQEQRLTDPGISEEDKEFIRECLGYSMKAAGQGSAGPAQTADSAKVKVPNTNVL